MKTGTELIAEERKRQIEKEGWTPEHDEQHRNRQLARAAEKYVRFAAEPNISRDYQRKNEHIPDGWPWEWFWWKPSRSNDAVDRIRDLTKAGALIAAEIDRLNRQKK
jgi:hypothetical protein